MKLNNEVAMCDPMPATIVTSRWAPQQNIRSPQYDSWPSELLLFEYSTKWKFNL